MNRIKICVALKLGEQETGAAGGHLAPDEEKVGLENEAKSRIER